MRRRTIQAAVVALALAASAAIAHAGGGGEGGIAGTFLFDCYLINGVNAPQGLDLSDQFGERTGCQARQGEAPLHTRRRNDHIRNSEPGSLLGRGPHQVLRGVAQGHQPEGPESRHRSVRHGDGERGRAELRLCRGLQVRRGGDRLRAHPGVRLSRRALLRSGVLALGVEPGESWARSAAGPGLRLPRRRGPRRAAALEAVRIRAGGSDRVRRAAGGGKSAVACRAGFPRREHRGAHCARADDLELYRTTVSLLQRLAGRRFSSLGPTERIELMTRHRLNSADVRPGDDLGPFRRRHARREDSRAARPDRRLLQLAGGLGGGRLRRVPREVRRPYAVHTAGVLAPGGRPRPSWMRTSASSAPARPAASWRWSSPNEASGSSSWRPVPGTTSRGAGSTSDGT